MCSVLLVSALILALPARAQEPSRVTTAPLGDLPGNPPSLPVSPITLSHSVSLTVQPGNSQACGSTQSGYTSQNSFWRVFDLDGDFGLTSLFDVQDITFGVDNTNGIFDVEVRAYTLSGTFTTDHLTLVGESNIQLDHASNGMLVSVPLTNVTVSHLSDLVIEIDVPSGEAQPALFYPASNDLGQSAPSWLSASACGFLQPTDLATIGYPNMHLVMVVSGDIAVPTAVTMNGFERSATPNLSPVALAAGSAAAIVVVIRRRAAVL